MNVSVLVGQLDMMRYIHVLVDLNAAWAVAQHDWDLSNCGLSAC